jgi:hypothetical protein
MWTILVFRNLHQIANLHVNRKLKFYKHSSEQLQSLIHSSRIFEEVEFLYEIREDQFKFIEEIISFTKSTLKKCQ